ncbi:MAG: S-layer homology domain-containing protein, partial [Eubacteriales bacterium]|nr:S-layer homology domain-containing protein [Eubacteriales bacterium]
WYTDSALTNGVTKVRLTRNMKVYAGWEKISADEEIVEEYEFPFTDVYDRDWFYSDVDYVAQNGLMRGTSADKFSPYSTTTRAMIVTVLYRMEGEPDAGENSFVDVPDGAYYTDAVAWASENGIVNGYGQGRFGPNDSITREQLAAILYRYSVYKGYDVSVGEDTNILSFDDIADLSDYAFTFMQWACGAGLIGGMGDGRLAPKGNATRCQIAAVLHRYCDNFGE